MAWRVSEKAPEISACDATMAAAVAMRDHRIECPPRHQGIERVADGGRVGHQQRALSEVVEHQRRQDDREPGEADRPRAEVPHVGIQRLATRHDEHDRAEDEEARGRRRA